jgi:two-component system OmpR family sensor kinase
VQVGAEDDAYSVDPQAFGRLIDNLMSNAVNAIGEGGTITAHLRQRPTSLDLTVADDGPGMPEKFLPMAFDRFSRPDESRSTRTGGSGLGLALVQAVATAAGGTAELQNTNPGLLVSVSIPRSVALGVNP